MQDEYKHQENTLKVCMQEDNTKLHAILSNFHIEQAQNEATVQHIHTKQVITTICPKQQLGTLQSSKQHATGNI